MHTSTEGNVKETLFLHYRHDYSCRYIYILCMQQLQYKVKQIHKIHTVMIIKLQRLSHGISRHPASPKMKKVY